SLFLLHHVRSSLCSPLSMTFFTAHATTEIYLLSLHDALPISRRSCSAATSGRGCRNTSTRPHRRPPSSASARRRVTTTSAIEGRSEEHTSELQSHLNLVCRLLLEKKKHSLSSSTTTKTMHTPL